MLNKLHYLTKFISSTMLHSECYWTISQNISFRIQTCRRRIIISRHMIHKIQYDCIILFHVTFFVDYRSKYFLFGQKFYSLCMRACMCARGRTSVCVCVWDQWLSSIMTSCTSSYFLSLSLVTICVVSFCFTHVKVKTTFWYITK